VKSRSVATLPAVAVRGAVVHRQLPVAGRQHLVGGDASGRQQLGGLRIQAQLGDRAALGVGAQIEQPPGLVVGEQQPPFAVQDQDALAHGVQHRVMVLVHPGHLQGPQPVRLPPQPAADRRRPGRGQGQPGRRRTQQDRQLPVDDSPHLAERDPGGHDPHDPALAVPFAEDRDGRLHQPPDRPVDRLRDDAPRQHRFQVADELLADPVRLGMGEANPLGVRHHDEVDPGPLTGRLRPRLQHGGGVRRGQCLDDPRRIRECLGDGERTVAGLQGAVVARLQHKGGHRAHAEQQHDHDLQNEDLTGHAAYPAPQPEHKPMSTLPGPKRRPVRVRWPAAS
jgi:hypothetical protein